MSFIILERWQVVIPNNTVWAWIILLCALIAAVVCFGAYRKLVKDLGKSLFYFFAISLTNILVVLLLLALYLPIEKINSLKKQDVLLTVGVNQQQIDNLALENINHIYFLASNNEIEHLSINHLNKQLLQLDAIEQLPVLTTNLAIYGDGLKAQQLSVLNHIAITFYPSKKITGVTELQWQKELIQGQLLVVKGQYQQGEKLETNAADKNYENSAKISDEIVEVALFDPFDKKITSQIVKNNEVFTLQAQPKAHGQFVYRLKVISRNGQVLSSEPVAISVEREQLVKLLIKQSAPSFETRQLKNWAAEQGALVVVQSQISRDKVISQIFNKPVDKSFTNSHDFNAEYLAFFDLLVIDGRGLLNLSSGELISLQQAVNDGLGVYIIADTDLISALSKGLVEQKNISLLNSIVASFSLPLEQTNDLKQTSQLFWQNNAIASLLPLLSASLNAQSSKVLVNGSNNRVIVAREQHGLGQVAISLLSQSYQLLTREQKLAYSQYWQHLISELSRTRTTAYWLASSNKKVNWVAEPTIECALVPTINDSDLAGKAPVFAEKFLLLTDLSNQNRYCGIYWSQHQGWSAFDLFDSHSNRIDKQWLYSYDKNDWRAWQQSIKQKNTREAVNSKTLEVKTTEPLNKNFIWIVLLLSLTVLWLEHKKRNHF